MCLFCTCVTATVAVVVGAHKMSFTLNWWAFIFPNAGLTLATIQAGKVLNSNALNGIASALTILLVIMWLFTAVCCVRALYRGEIMWPGKDEDKSMERERAFRYQGDRIVKSGLSSAPTQKLFCFIIGDVAVKKLQEILLNLSYYSCLSMVSIRFLTAPKVFILNGLYWDW